MATYNSLDQLYKAMGAMIEKSLSKTATDIMELARGFIMSEFYGQYTPTQYERSFQLLESLTKTKVSHIGNTYMVEIFLDPSSASQGYSSGDALYVWDLAASGIHGNNSIQTEGRFWESTLNEVMKNWKSYLIKNGLKVI